MFFEMNEKTKEQKVRFEALLLEYKNDEISLEEFKKAKKDESLIVMKLYPSHAHLTDYCREIGMSKEKYQALNFIVWMS